MLELTTELETVGDFQIEQHDFRTDIQDVTSLHCASEDRPLQLGIYYGDRIKGHASYHVQPPYYSLEWLTDMEGQAAVDIIHETADQLGADKFLAQCSESQSAQADELLEASTLKKVMKRVIIPNLAFLRVEGATDDYALVWSQPPVELQPEGHRTKFGFIGSLVINEGYVADLVEKTIVADGREKSLAALATLDQIFEKYRDTQPDSLLAAA